MAPPEPCQFLSWDTNFFGRRIARVKERHLHLQHVEAIQRWCERHAIDCLYFLADSNHAEIVRIAEDHGFRLVDVRITLQQALGGRRAEYPDNRLEMVRMRRARLSDIPALQNIARTSHRDSRFYFDPGFPAESCAALYQAWIKRSCEGYAEVVLVATVEDQPVGYASCHLSNHPLPGQIGLVGVGPQIRGRGIGQILVNQALQWFAEREVEVVSVVTQGRNIVAQRLYQHCGFFTHAVQLWYHKWLPGRTS